MHSAGHPRAGGREALLPLLVAFLSPAALVGAAAGLHFWRVGLLGDVLQLTVLNHFIGIANYEYPAFPNLLPLFGQDPALRDVSGRGQYMPALLFTADWEAVRESWLYQDTALYDVVLKDGTTWTVSELREELAAPKPGPAPAESQ